MIWKLMQDKIFDHQNYFFQIYEDEIQYFNGNQVVTLSKIETKSILYKLKGNYILFAEITDTILNKSIKINNNNQTPLHLCCKYQFEKIIKFLITEINSDSVNLIVFFAIVNLIKNFLLLLEEMCLLFHYLIYL